MSEVFDPYRKWLGIRDADRPPNNYQLLGLEPFESDREVISNAADRQMAHVRTFQASRHSAVSQRVLNELAAARVTLLNAEKKRVYDAELRAAAESRQQLRPLESVFSPDVVFSPDIAVEPLPEPVFDPPVATEPPGAIDVSPAPMMPSLLRRRRPGSRRVDHLALTVSLVVTAVLLGGLMLLVVVDQLRGTPKGTTDGSSSSAQPPDSPPPSN